MYWQELAPHFMKTGEVALRGRPAEMGSQGGAGQRPSTSERANGPPPHRAGRTKCGPTIA